MQEWKQSKTVYKNPIIYHLSLLSWKEIVLKNGTTENQELPGNLPNIGSLFDANRPGCKVPISRMFKKKILL